MITRKVDPEVARLRSRLAIAVRERRDDEVARLRPQLAQTAAAVKRRAAIDLLISEAAWLTREDIDRLLSGLPWRAER